MKEWKNLLEEVWKLSTWKENQNLKESEFFCGASSSAIVKNLFAIWYFQISELLDFPDRRF